MFLLILFLQVLDVSYDKHLVEIVSVVIHLFNFLLQLKVRLVHPVPRKLSLLPIDVDHGVPLELLLFLNGFLMRVYAALNIPVLF